LIPGMGKGSVITGKVIIMTEISYFPMKRGSKPSSVVFGNLDFVKVIGSAHGSEESILRGKPCGKTPSALSL
jgi:hypothetical protein